MTFQTYIFTYSFSEILGRNWQIQMLNHRLVPFAVFIVLFPPVPTYSRSLLKCGMDEERI